MLTSITESTMKQYIGPIRSWCNFCLSKNIDIYSFKDTEVLEFLTEKFNSGFSYGSLNSMRSAISFIAKENFASNVLLNRFFKGVYKRRPTKPKYDRTWDPSIVLNALTKLYPLASLSLRQLTEKLVTLLALGTGHRVQTLSLIKLSNIKKCAEGLEVEIADPIKTSKVGVSQPLLRLPYFQEKPELCLASIVEEYIEVTKNLRNNYDLLILAVKKPHKPASSQTISRWIKSVLTSSGIDENYTALSTRHASTSLALQKGVDIQTIRSTVGWSKSSEVFAKFYNRPMVSSKTLFAEAIFL